MVWCFKLGTAIGGLEERKERASTEDGKSEITYIEE